MKGNFCTTLEECKKSNNSVAFVSFVNYDKVSLFNFICIFDEFSDNDVRKNMFFHEIEKHVYKNINEIGKKYSEIMPIKLIESLFYDYSILLSKDKYLVLEEKDLEIDTKILIYLNDKKDLISISAYSKSGIEYYKKFF